MLTFRTDFSQKRWAFLSLGWHVLDVFRLDVLWRQQVLRDVSLLYWINTGKWYVKKNSLNDENYLLR